MKPWWRVGIESPRPGGPRGHPSKQYQGKTMGSPSTVTPASRSLWQRSRGGRHAGEAPTTSYTVGRSPLAVGYVGLSPRVGGRVEGLCEPTGVHGERVERALQDLVERPAANSPTRTEDGQPPRPRDDSSQMGWRGHSKKWSRAQRLNSPRG